MNPYTHRATCRIEARDTLTEILCCLTPEQRGVVAFVIDGWTISEIAELLGVQRSTVSMRLRFARARIRRRLPHLAREIEGRSWGREGGRE